MRFTVELIIMNKEGVRDPEGETLQKYLEAVTYAQNLLPLVGHLLHQPYGLGVGMMPHPERASFKLLSPDSSTDGLLLLRGLAR